MRRLMEHKIRKDIHTDLETLSLDKVHSLVVLKEPSSNFWTLGVQHDGTLRVLSFLESLSESVYDFSVGLTALGS